MDTFGLTEILVYDSGDVTDVDQHSPRSYSYFIGNDEFSIGPLL